MKKTASNVDKMKDTKAKPAKGSVPSSTPKAVMPAKTGKTKK
jgi:hypothetical protein